MKKLIISLLLFSAIVIGCSKSNTTPELSTTDSQPPVTSKPVADFKINNMVDDSWILEGSTIEFDNKSMNADSYYWDFSNGVYSADKIPTDISFAPCGKTYTITLTVKNKSGETSIYSQTYNILCSGKHAPAGG